MTTDNAAAQIGSLTPATKKIPSIGAYVQDKDAPTADGSYWGIGPGVWSYNWLGEAAGFTAPSNAGPTGIVNVNSPPDTPDQIGKKAIWSTITANLTVPTDGRVGVTAGGIATAALGTGAYEVMIPAGTVLVYQAGPPLVQPYFWAFEYVAP